MSLNHKIYIANYSNDINVDKYKQHDMFWY
jgi:hypothetical protein